MIDEDTLDELLYVMTEPFKYSWDREDFINNEHGDSLRENLKRSLSQSLTGFDGTDLESGKKPSTNREGQFKDRFIPTQFLDLQWTRMVAVFSIKNPLVYHKLAQAFFCAGTYNDAEFQHNGMRYGSVIRGFSNNGPPGKIARALVRQLSDFMELSCIRMYFNPLIMCTDFSFSDRFFQRRRASRDCQSILVFTMDMPTIFTDALMNTLCSYIEAGLYYEYKHQKNFEYQLYTYNLSDFVLKNAK